jgi:hypothetical protein
MPDEELAVADVPHRLIQLPSYLQALRSYRKLEPKLHDAVREALAKEIEGGQLDEMPGTGGWIKGRVASPSRNIGKSGGFRVIYLFFRIHKDIYLQGIYDHRQKANLESAEKEALKFMAQEYKRAYGKGKKP